MFLKKFWEEFLWKFVKWFLEKSVVALPNKSYGFYSLNS